MNNIKVNVIMPQVWMPSIREVRVELAKCASRAQISRGRKKAYNVTMYNTIGHNDSEGYIEEFSKAEALISRLLGFKPHPHESVLEHGNITIDFQMSRIATHELVRHRHIAVTQESTRYIGYNKKDEVTFIDPTLGSCVGEYEFDIDPINTMRLHQKCDGDIIVNCMAHELNFYNQLIKLNPNIKREQARYLLPGALASHISVTANLRSWRHIVALRDQKKAAPEMQYIFGNVREYLEIVSPCLVEGLSDGVEKWTQKEIDEHKKEADELFEKLGWDR